MNTEYFGGSSVDTGQRVGTGMEHGGITFVLQTQYFGLNILFSVNGIRINAYYQGNVQLLI